MFVILHKLQVVLNTAYHLFDIMLDNIKTKRFNMMTDTIQERIEQFKNIIQDKINGCDEQSTDVYTLKDYTHALSNGYLKSTPFQSCDWGDVKAFPFLILPTGYLGDNDINKSVSAYIAVNNTNQVLYIVGSHEHNVFVRQEHPFYCHVFTVEKDINTNNYTFDELKTLTKSLAQIKNTMQYHDLPADAPPLEYVNDYLCGVDLPQLVHIINHYFKGRDVSDLYKGLLRLVSSRYVSLLSDYAILITNNLLCIKLNQQQMFLDYPMLKNTNKHYDINGVIDIEDDYRKESLYGVYELNENINKLNKKAVWDFSSNDFILAVQQLQSKVKGYMASQLFNAFVQHTAVYNHLLPSVNNTSALYWFNLFKEHETFAFDWLDFKHGEVSPFEYFDLDNPDYDTPDKNIYVKVAVKTVFWKLVYLIMLSMADFMERDFMLLSKIQQDMGLPKDHYIDFLIDFKDVV